MISFIRSLCDQLYGDDSRHMDLRGEIVRYMLDHEADFAPFLDEGVTFARYSLLYQ